MKILKIPIVSAMGLVASFVYIASQFHLPLPLWIYYYVNDLLCMPLVLTLCLAMVRFIKKSDTIYVPLTAILGLTIFYGIYFEWLMPQLNSRYVADIIDLYLYAIGSSLFIAFQKRLF